jgi:hypothetical protein
VAAAGNDPGAHLDRHSGDERAALDGPLVSELRAAAPWQEILVVDDGSVDDGSADATAAQAAAGATVVRHPDNKGHGAALKTGSRQSEGAFVLIVDADGRHRPAGAVRLVGHLAPMNWWSGHARRPRRPTGGGAAGTRCSTPWRATWPAAGFRT